MILKSSNIDFRVKFYCIISQCKERSKRSIGDIGILFKIKSIKVCNEKT